MAIRPRINWTGVDLTRDAAEIAEELGCSLNAIYTRRRNLGIKLPNKAGGSKPGSGTGAKKGEVRKKNCPRMTKLSITLPDDVLAAIDKKANRYGWSRAEVIRRAARHFLKMDTDNEQA